MRENKKAQFVCFETTLDKEEFLKRWKQFKRSANSDTDVTMQQSQKDGLFRYIAQHRLKEDDAQFLFSKEGRSSRIAQERITTTIVGGYSMFQAEMKNDAGVNDSKIFVFLTEANIDLSPFKALSAGGKLNIYQAYYQNCKYSYILEYFVKSKNTPLFLEQLKSLDAAEVGVYKELKLQKMIIEKKKEEHYVWPSF